MACVMADPPKSSAAFQCRQLFESGDVEAALDGLPKFLTAECRYCACSHLVRGSIAILMQRRMIAGRRHQGGAGEAAQCS